MCTDSLHHGNGLSALPLLTRAAKSSAAKSSAAKTRSMESRLLTRYLFLVFNRMFLSTRRPYHVELIVSSSEYCWVVSGKYYTFGLYCSCSICLVAFKSINMAHFVFLPFSLMSY